MHFPEFASSLEEEFPDRSISLPSIPKTDGTTVTLVQSELGSRSSNLRKDPYPCSLHLSSPSLDVANCKIPSVEGRDDDSGCWPLWPFCAAAWRSYSFIASNLIFAFSSDKACFRETRCCLMLGRSFSPPAFTPASCKCSRANSGLDWRLSRGDG